MDIQFIQFNDTLAISGARIIPKFLPPSLEISGPDMSSAIEVRVNDAKSPSFIISSSTTLVAQIPDSEVSNIINAVSVVSSEFTARNSCLIEFVLGANPKKVSGVKQLIQTFLRLLLTTPECDAFNKNLGGGLQKLVGDKGNESAKQNSTSDFASAVNRTTEQLIALQSRQGRLADDERLLNTQLLELKFYASTTSLCAKIRLYTHSGKVAVANLEL